MAGALEAEGCPERCPGSCRPQALPTLEPVILTGKAVASRVAAIDALGMLCFVGSEGPHEALPVMALLAKAFTRGEVMCGGRAGLGEPALGWSLLLYFSRNTKV